MNSCCTERFDGRSEIWQRSLKRSFFPHGVAAINMCMVYVVNMMYFLQRHDYKVSSTRTVLLIISFDTSRKLIIPKMFRGTSCLQGIVVFPEISKVNHLGRTHLDCQYEIIFNFVGKKSLTGFNNV